MVSIHIVLPGKLAWDRQPAELHVQLAGLLLLLRAAAAGLQCAMSHPSSHIELEYKSHQRGVLLSPAQALINVHGHGLPQQATFKWAKRQLDCCCISFHTQCCPHSTHVACAGLRMRAREDVLHMALASGIDGSSPELSSTSSPIRVTPVRLSISLRNSVDNDRSSKRLAEVQHYTVLLNAEKCPALSA